MRKAFLLSVFGICLLSSCTKQYSGYCISGDSPSNYTTLKFQEEAATKAAAENQVEKVMNQKFPESGPWSCEVYD